MFKREWIFQGKWKRLSPGAKALFVPLIAHTDEHGDCWPGRRRLMKLAKIGSTQATAAIQELKDHEYFNLIVTKSRGIQGITYKYNFQDGRVESDSIFLVYNFLFEPRYQDKCLWHELKPAAKSLYIVLRAHGLSPELSEENYRDREYDFVDIQTIGNDCLAWEANIDPRSVYRARTELDNKGLFCKVDGEWVVQIHENGQS